MDSRRESQGKKRSRLPLLAGAVALSVIVLVAVSGCGDGDGEGESVKLKSVAEANSAVEGIPQQGMVLGNPKAPVELVEYCDLQSPACREYSEDVLPQIIRARVEAGEVSFTFRNNVFIDDDSIVAGAAMLAAAEQGKGWNFLEVFYRNQGEALFESFVTEEFLEAVGKAAGVPNLAKWNERRKSQDLAAEVEATTAEAKRRGISSRGPIFTTTSSHTNGPRAIGMPSGPVSMEERINEAISGKFKPIK